MSVSKLVGKRALIARTVQTVAEKRAEEIAAALAPRLLAEGVHEASLVGFVRALAAALARAQRELEERDVELSRALARDARRRAARDAAVEVLKNRLAIARAAYEHGIRADETQSDLIDTRPRTPDQLVHQATAVATLIDETPIPSGSDAMIDRTRLAESVRDAIAKATAALDEVKLGERETQRVRGERDRLAAAWVEIYAGVAQAFAGLATAAGRHDIAARVRPTARRRKGEPENADLEENDPEPEPPPVVDERTR